jgi:hypothetical protein
MDPYFPMHLWDRLLSQPVLTLNLLRTSRLHPQMSAAAHLYGPVDYIKTPFESLLPQQVLTLNLLWTSILHPYMYAAAHLYGPVDSIKTPFAPAGCNIIAHEKPHQRRTWAPHGKHGYSLGPAMHHYRCQNVYITSTVSERIVDTLDLFPRNSTMPQISSLDRLLMAPNTRLTLWSILALLFNFQQLEMTPSHL